MGLRDILNGGAVQTTVAPPKQELTPRVAAVAADLGRVNPPDERVATPDAPADVKEEPAAAATPAAEQPKKRGRPRKQVAAQEVSTPASTPERHPAPAARKEEPAPSTEEDSEEVRVSFTTEFLVKQLRDRGYSVTLVC
jgi:hypothetical protein